MKKSIVLFMVAALMICVSTYAQNSKKEAAPKAEPEQVEKKSGEGKACSAEKKDKACCDKEAGKKEKACCKEKGTKSAGTEAKSCGKKNSRLNWVILKKNSRLNWVILKRRTGLRKLQAGFV
jgi:hypothetical protein